MIRTSNLRATTLNSSTVDLSIVHTQYNKQPQKVMDIFVCDDRRQLQSSIFIQLSTFFLKYMDRVDNNEAYVYTLKNN